MFLSPLLFNLPIKFHAVVIIIMATRYGLESPGIKSRWRRAVPCPSRPALGHTQPPAQWVPVQDYVALTTHPTLAPGLKKEQSYISTPLCLRSKFGTLVYDRYF